jgi:GTPase
MNNILAIVGRPNVGKSTLFNRLVQKREAIVDSTPGVTRDRHYGKSDWNGKDFSIIDTGGYSVGSDDIFEEEIRRQVQLAVDESSAILFVVDAHEGIHTTDEEIALLLRKSSKPVYLVVNKVDTTDRHLDATEFYALGFDEIFPISSSNGSGTGELLDKVVSELPNAEWIDEEEGLPRFAIIGRPNVGKSSFINALTGDNRNIVTEIAGTTRDSVHTRYQMFGHDFILVDTAGVRKRTKVHENLEFYSVMRSIRAIESADVCFLILDATQGIEAQDLSIFHLAEKNNKGIIILVNKWDMVEKDHQTHVHFQKAIEERIAPSMDIPILFISALNKQRLLKALEEGMAVYQRRRQRIPTSRLNEVMLPIIEGNPPPALKGKYVKIKYITQLPTGYPQFVFFANLPQYVKDSYKRFLERQLREHFDLAGSPAQIYMRKK